MNQRYTHLCKPSVAVTKWLFGDNLSNQVKDLREEQKTTAGVRRRQSRWSSCYQPYQHHVTQRQRYVDAGWFPSNRGSPRDRTSSDGRPFLGQSSRLHHFRRRFQQNKNKNKKPASKKQD